MLVCTQNSQNWLIFDLYSTELLHNIYIEGVISTLNVAHRLIHDVATSYIRACVRNLDLWVHLFTFFGTT